MSALEATLTDRIRAHGPLTVADYMAACLYDPTHGYYMTRDPFGAKGDFTTAPEISQMFGEILGAWVADAWLKMGGPSPFYLAELGPGRGTLMADVLRILGKVLPPCRAAARPTLIEVSPFLKAVQEKTLHGQSAVWRTALPDRFDAPVILLANEVLDALPVRQFEHADGAYYERLVGVVDGRLGWVRAATPTPLPHTAPFVEIHEAQHTLLGQVRAAISKGYALFLDYGGVGQADTLQAVRAHGFVDVFDGPGTADLTTHVNFADVCATLGEKSHGPTDMALFLTELGLPLRAATLWKAAPQPERDAIEAATHRLLHPNAMGRHFQVVAWASDNVPPPAGFDHANARH